MKVACIQSDTVPFERQWNLDRASLSVWEAVRHGAELIVLPEYFSSGCRYDSGFVESAEPLDGPTVSWMRTRSRETGAWLAGGIVEEDAGGVYNTLVLVGPSGVSWTYRKRCLPLFERLYFRSGSEVGVFDTPLGRLGVMLCWDMIHDRPLAELKNRIDLLLVCAAWPDVAAGRTWHPAVVASPRETRSWLHVSTKWTLPGLAQWLSRPPVERPRSLARTLGVPVVFCNMAGRFETPVPWLAGLQFSCPFAGASAILEADGSGTVGPCRVPAVVHGDVRLGMRAVRRAA